MKALYAAYRRLPLSDIGSTWSARSARVTATGTEWALVAFNPAPSTPISLAFDFQDGTNGGAFTRSRGEPWKIVSIGSFIVCRAGIPAAVARLWGLLSCPALSSHLVLRRHTGFLPLSSAGSTTDLVDAAVDEEGVLTDPASSDFSFDCNPYATLIGEGASSSGCNTDPRHDVKDENQVWCADMMTWLWQQVGVADSSTSTLGAWSGSFAYWGVSHSEPVTLNGPSNPNASTPQVGDAMVFLHGVTQNQINGKNIPVGNSDHVAIVTAVNSDGTIDTVNGDIPWGSSTIGVYEVDNLTPSATANQIEPPNNPNEQWVFVSPNLGSGGPSRPPAPTTPVVDFPGWSAEHVFAQGTDSTVQEIERTSSGWGNWISLGNNITGTPAGFAEQSGQLDVFANTAGGVLQGRREASGGWESWVTLAPGSGLPTNFSDSPYPVYNTALSRNEVYDTTGTGAVYVLYGGSGPMTSWTAWTQLSGLTVQGPVAPVYDPINNQMDVFATSSSGTLYYDARASGSSWTGWFPVAHSAGMPTDFNRSPVAVYDPVKQRIEVYDTESNGTIWMADGTGANPGNWTDTPFEFSSLPIIGKPAVLVDNQVAGNNQLDLFATSSAGYLNENTNNGSGWSGWVRVDSATRQILNGTPFAVYDQVLGRNEAFFTEAGSQLGYYYGTDADASKWTGLKVFSTQMTSM